MYSQHAEVTGGKSIPADALELLLWGDIYFDHEEQKFSKEKPAAGAGDQGERTFVQFVLEPLWKLIGYTLGEEDEDLCRFLAKKDIYLTNKELRLSTKDLLKVVGARFFEENSCAALVDACVEHIKDPRANARNKIKNLYSGDQNGPIAEVME